MSLAALSGSLLSTDALGGTIPEALGDDFDRSGAQPVQRRVCSWHQRVRHEMGPACSARAVFDRLASPLLHDLGFGVVVAPAPSGATVHALLTSGERPVGSVVVTPWGRDPGSAWREAVLQGIGHNVRWCFCMTGPSLRIVDAERTYSRRFAQFELDLTADDGEAFGVLWGLLRADAFGRVPALIERAVVLSERHRATVRASLQEGVHEALTQLLHAFSATRRGRRPGVRHAELFDESLVIVYRVLFLLFAEARGLVPRWHPVYRDSYTIESLRPLVERGGEPNGLWESLQAIARLAHRGCRAGSLRVPPFNGRLFSPAHAPLAESVALDDAPVRQALLALTTRNGRSGRERIAYGDLGVEHLGGVYERVLDFEPAVTAGGTVRLRHAERRKATGSFYTPRALTEYVVRRTLAPLVRDGGPESILALRVLDPAMGSGAFLVAACRYLAAAYERALVLSGAVTPSDVTADERAGFRRTIAQRCLFGVDVNPMAVQLGRLSLWLATLAADRPLTFLDHHLRTGNSLVGASLSDVARQPPGAGRTLRRPLPLFDEAEVDRALGAAIGPRISIAVEPGDTIEQVRTKEQSLARIGAATGPLAKWRDVTDLWCASWFGLKEAAKRGVFASLVDEILGQTGALPKRLSGDLLERARAIASDERFFHWTLEFPEVFFAADGAPLPSAGFDAVLGNPPWEMLRGDRGDAPARQLASSVSSRLTTFARGSGVYELQGEGHANLYQLFLERALSLVRDGGRIGMVLPSGFASDHGCSGLRRRILETTHVDTFTCVENRDGLFPIHRGLKFLLVTSSRGTPTTSLPCRYGVRSPETLERLSDEGVDDRAVHVPRRLLSEISGEEQLAIPELRTSADLDLVSAIVSRIPPLGGNRGWNVRFGRELNASDDKPHFVRREDGGPDDLPVIEGKQIQPFTIDASSARFHIAKDVARRLLPGCPFDRPRLAYRDVAAATNRLTLIAAIVPARVVTTHTLFCLKGDVDEPLQQYLCGILNSYVANYLVRVRVGTHVTVSIVERLPVPIPDRDSGPFMEIGDLARQIASCLQDRAAHARLQAIAARLYRLTRVELAHVLSTFPLVEEQERRAAAAAFEARGDAI